MAKLDSLDIEELACAVCGLNEEQTNQAHENYEFDDLVFEKYGVDLDAFGKIAEDLIRFTNPVISPLTDTKYHAFVKNDKHGMVAIAKVKAED